MPTIVLVHPQIPQNTGNIVRTCAVTGSDLILVHPLGFRTDDRSLKRAGLDYWEGVRVSELDDLVPFLESTDRPFYFFSARAEEGYCEAKYPENALLIFGSETSGLPQLYWERWPQRFFCLPMLAGSRCLNLASAAAVVVYEAWRQRGFTG